MINGPKDPKGGKKKPNADEWPYKGRTKEKSFLYEIVANEWNGIDVDKFDYFVRWGFLYRNCRASHCLMRSDKEWTEESVTFLKKDCHHLGMKNNFDHLRFIQFARVCEVEGLKHICSRDKVLTLIAEAFLKADKHIQIKGSQGQEYTLSTAIGDMEAYTKLTDHVFEQILNSSSVELAEAKKILERIISRDHYKFLGEIKPRQVPTKESQLQWQKELAAAVPEGGNGGVTLTHEDFVVSVATFDYGMKDKDPINNVYFYGKRNPDTAKPITRDQVSKLLPECFSEQLIRVYSKKSDEQSVEAARKHFSKWCKEKGFPESQNGDTAAP
ncbi:hypothetical protein FQN60_005369 [Etheostoma spectabile]|uniref:Deoxynucleoside triphosphate triphosphohydrolase SAMHD1 n=1 Tax=Etheostoma spectabile TaxID=54343 RepID=A0A5J5CBS2_9PERO|nr:hypothetical protein FQN60_005369 [Etheostoma spectabile]